MLQRDYDIVLFGATGFTGTLSAEYLCRHAPENVRWALAGRNQQKLEGVREQLAKLSPDSKPIDLLHADSTDLPSLDRLAASTRVLISTVGPYIRYGEPLVAACARAGTDYVDLTGEPEFVDLMYERYDQAARLSGARIVHCCGFDSIPADLGAQFTVELLPADEPMTISAFVHSNGRFSGGTFHSAVEALGRPAQTIKAARRRRALEPPTPGRRAHWKLSPPHRESSLDGWAMPLPTIDPQVVLRSARSLERYGPDFTYEHNLIDAHAWMLAGLTGGAAGLFALSQLSPTRNWLLGRISPGEGPSEEQRERAWFEITFLGRANGKRVRTRVSGADPGYGETSKMLTESALCLACDELSPSAGQLTPAVAMGRALTERLQRAGISFTVLEDQ